MTTRADVDATLTAWAEEVAAQAKADGRVQGQRDRQPEVDDLSARLAAAVAEYEAHMATHAPAPWTPVRVNLDQVRDRFAIPAEVQLVPWGDVARAGDTMGDVGDRLSAQQALVLEERDAPYLFDARDGFYASGASAVQLADGGRQRVVSKRDRWFSLARFKRGFIGLGPDVRFDYLTSDWTSPAQPRPTSAKAPGRFWWDTTGTRKHELVGAQEKVVECTHPDAYFANFTAPPAPDLGGIAYHFLTMKGGTVERVAGTGAWRGFAGVPNGETGMVSFNGGRYRVLGLDADGAGIGSSPLMVNSSPGGTVDHARFADASAGMPTIWRSTGDHVWSDVESVGNPGHGINLEECGDGFTFRWHRGRNTPGGFHVGIDARGRATVELVDVDAADLGSRSGVAMAPATVQVQGYGQSRANRERITITATKGGQPVPVKLYT